MTGCEASRSTIQGIVAAVCARWWDGSWTGWDELLAPDSVVLGPAARQVFPSRDQMPTAAPPFDSAPDPPTPAPGRADIRVGLAAAGRSGWFWGLAGTPRAATGSGAQVRVSGCVSCDDDGRWTVEHLFVSEAMSNDRVAQYESLAPTLTLLPHRVEPGAEDLVDLLHANLGVERLDTLPRRDDVVVIGSDASEVFEGAQAYLDAFEPVRAQLAELQSTVRVDVVGGIHAALTPDGGTGYLATHLCSTVAGNRLPTLRVGWVFSRLAENEFRLVCDHHAFPTPHPPDPAIEEPGR